MRKKKKQIEPLTNFTAPYLNLIAADEAKFILEHAEKQLKEVNDEGAIIINRTTSSMTLVSALTVALMGFLVSKWYKTTEPKIDQLMAIAFLLGVYFVIILFVIGRNLAPHKYFGIGAQPINFFNDKVFNSKNSAIRLKLIQANEIYEYQKRIANNKEVNDKRWGRYRTGLIMLFLSPLAIILFAVLVNYLFILAKSLTA